MAGMALAALCMQSCKKDGGIVVEYVDKPQTVTVNSYLAQDPDTEMYTCNGVLPSQNIFLKKGDKKRVLLEADKNNMPIKFASLDPELVSVDDNGNIQMLSDGIVKSKVLAAFDGNTVASYDVYSTGVGSMVCNDESDLIIDFNYMVQTEYKGKPVFLFFNTDSPVSSYSEIESSLDGEFVTFLMDDTKQADELALMDFSIFAYQREKDIDQFYGKKDDGLSIVKNSDGTYVIDYVSPAYYMDEDYDLFLPPSYAMVMKFHYEGFLCNTILDD